jgi:hypothetical protein
MHGWGITAFIIAVAAVFLIIVPIWLLWLRSFLKSISPHERNALGD